MRSGAEPTKPIPEPMNPRRGYFIGGDVYSIMMDYRILLKKGQDGFYVAQCLEVPGAISQGRTKAEALRNAKEALRLILEVLKEEAKEGEIARVTVDA